MKELTPFSPFLPPFNIAGILSSLQEKREKGGVSLPFLLLRRRSPFCFFLNWLPPTLSSPPVPPSSRNNAPFPSPWGSTDNMTLRGNPFSPPALPLLFPRGQFFPIPFLKGTICRREGDFFFFSPPSLGRTLLSTPPCFPWEKWKRGGVFPLLISSVSFLLLAEL